MAKKQDPMLMMLYHNYQDAFTSGVSERVEAALGYIQKGYDERSLVDDCLLFLDGDILDAPESTFDALTRVWFFPWRQACYELQEAFGHIILAHYKAAYDNIRRALELAIVGIYFMQEHVDEVKGRKWIEAEEQTPFFSRAIKEIRKSPRFKQACDDARWDELVREFYGILCDVVHVRGTKGAFDAVQPMNFMMNGVCHRTFNHKSVSSVLKVWVTAVRHIASALALENPILTVGLDMFSKFGFNPPLSGYFVKDQADRLRRLVLPEVLPVLDQIVTQDEDVLSVLHWFEEQPDLTAKQLEEQWEDRYDSWEASYKRRSGAL